MKFILPGIRDIAFGLLAWLFFQTHVHACGLNWSEPHSFFDKIDYQGHVYIIEHLADLDTGKIKLPIYLIFNSGNGYESPYAGILEMPLLSSRMEQVDGDTYLFRSPSGWLLPFRRNKDVREILDGSAGMKAKVDEQNKTVTAWSACGAKITFSHGRIIQLCLKETKLDYVYVNDRIAEIREGEKVFLRVNADSQTGEVSGISLGDQVIHFEWGQRPVVQNVDGKPTVVAHQKALSKVILPDGSEKTFEFGVDKQMQPTLKLNGKEEMTWSPATLLAHQVNGWTYNMKPGEGRFANAAIGRTNAKGQTEFWHYDGSKGIETVQGIDGVKKVRTWFVRGKFARKIRRIYEFNGSNRDTLYSASYDPEGRLIRYYKGNDRYDLEYDSKGQLSAFIENGIVAWAERYDKNGRIKDLIEGNQERHFSYNSDGSRQVIIYSNALQVILSYDPNGKLINSEIN